LNSLSIVLGTTRHVMSGMRVIGIAVAWTIVQETTGTVKFAVSFRMASMIMEKLICVARTYEPRDRRVLTTIARRGI
jgi:hypothetical protein